MKNLTLPLVVLLSACSTTPNRETASLASSPFEKVPPDESRDIVEVIKIIGDSMNRKTPDAEGRLTRSEHAKAHGCVEAYFIVADAVPTQYRTGIFKNEGQSLAGVVRLSNGSGKIERDINPQSRGFALKLTENNQDFLFHNHPAFLAGNVKDVVKWMRLNKNMGPGGLIEFLTSLSFRDGLRNTLEAKIAAEIGNNRPSSPLKMTYHSGVPYLLGEKPVKYRLSPCTPEERSFRLQNKLKYNYLKEALDKQLNEEQNPGCFAFEVQPFENETLTPVEDAKVTWTTPFTRIATIIIPKNQDLDSRKAIDKCEDLAFSPWNHLPEHRPVGGINRLRRAAYAASQRLRKP